MKLIWVIEANYVEGYIIDFTFNDGVKKQIDLSDCLSGEIYKPLQNIEEFKKFKTSDWSIVWANGADIAPEFLYSY